MRWNYGCCLRSSPQPKPDPLLIFIYSLLHTDETAIPHKEEQKSAHPERFHDPASTEN